jgi:hypothetical protein
MEFQDFVWSMLQILCRLSSVLSFPITSPVNEVLEGTTKEFGVSNMVYLIFLFAFYQDWFWQGQHLSVNFIPL